MISATLVRQADIDSLWPQICDDIIRCIERTPTYFTAADLWTMCRGGEAFLIIMHDEQAILGAAVWRFEGSNFVCMMLTGTRADEWIVTLYDQASLLARRGGAKQLMASGRTSLFRKLRKHLSTRVKMIRCTVTVEV